MINGKKWHYLALKSLSALLRRTTSKHVGDFYCLNFFHSYSTEKKNLKKHYKVCKNNDYCYVEMPNEDNKILKYSHGKKSMKSPFIIYADLECLPEKLNLYHDNPDLKCLLEKICSEKSSTTKENKHMPSGYSLFTQCSFDSTKNKFDCYRGCKDCMERFCKDFKEHATKIINY